MLNTHSIIFIIIKHIFSINKGMGRNEENNGVCVNPKLVN